MTEKKEDKKVVDEKQQAEALAKLEALIDRVHVAQNQYATFSEEKVNAIFKAAAAAADKMRIDLAEMAVAETGMGVLEDKIIKNHFASEYIYNKHKNTNDLSAFCWRKSRCAFDRVGLYTIRKYDLNRRG